MLLVVALVWNRGDDTRDSARRASTTPLAGTASSARAPTVVTPNVPAEPVAAQPGQPQPVPVDPASAPSLNAPVSKLAPAQKPFDRAETIAKREADLKLLDDTRTRLETDLAAAQASGDATAAHDLQIRIARVTGLRKQRTAELDKLRAGGELPP